MTRLLDDISSIIGTTLSELLEAVRIGLDGLSTDVDILYESLDINNAVGTDLERLGTVFGVERKEPETDTAYRTRIINFLVHIVERAIIIDGIDLIAQDVMGISPDIKEFPAFNFIGLTGQPYPGVLIDFTSAQILDDLEGFREFQRLTLEYKPAGVPYFIGAIEYFTELFNIITDVGDPLAIKGNWAEQLNPVFNIAKWDTDGKWNQSTWEIFTYIVDTLQIQHPFYKFLDIWNEGIIDEIGFEGTLFPTELFSAGIVDTEKALTVTFSDLMNTFADTIAKDGTLKFTETIIANDIQLQLIGDVFAKFVLSISEFQFVDTLKGTIDLHFVQPATIGGWDVSLFDSYRFDTNIIDTFLARYTRPLTESYVGVLDDSAWLIKAHWEDLISSFLDDISGTIAMKLTELVSTINDPIKFTGDLTLPDETPFTGTTVDTPVLLQPSVFDGWADGVGVLKLGTGKISQSPNYIEVDPTEVEGWDVALWNRPNASLTITVDYS
jgi:hypothetical protein